MLIILCDVLEPSYHSVSTPVPTSLRSASVHRRPRLIGAPEGLFTKYRVQHDLTAVFQLAYSIQSA